MAHAATNLSFIYFHEGDYAQARTPSHLARPPVISRDLPSSRTASQAVKYADQAMKHNRYNAKALVNKGNCMFMSGQYDEARQMYQEAMGAEADCLEARAHRTLRTACPSRTLRSPRPIAPPRAERRAASSQAIFNLALVNKRIGDHSSALGLFEKLHAIIPNSVEVHSRERCGARSRAHPGTPNPALTAARRLPGGLADRRPLRLGESVAQRDQVVQDPQRARPDRPVRPRAHRQHLPQGGGGGAGLPLPPGELPVLPGQHECDLVARRVLCEKRGRRRPRRVAPRPSPPRARHPRPSPRSHRRSRTVSPRSVRCTRRPWRTSSARRRSSRPRSSGS